MDKMTEISRLLDEIKKQFLEYEKATIALLECEVDDVEHYITVRSEIAIEVDELREELAKICRNEDGGEVLYKAAMANIDFERVPSEYQSIFYEGQAVRSVMHRVSMTEKQVIARMERLRSEALEHIRQNQNMPKIKRYLEDLSGGTIVGGLKDSKA